jgi:hypothetical protein
VPAAFCFRFAVPHPVKDIKIGTLKSIEKQSGAIWPGKRLLPDQP